MSSRFWIIPIAWIALAATGCKTLDLGKDESNAEQKDGPWWKQKKEDLPPAETPAKIVAIWSNSVFNADGTAPVRGLGGRIYFYDEKHKPVRVDGKLTVFLYDDTNKSETHTQEATKQVHFTPEQVAGNFTPSEFGASYSFWLPWGEVGGERTQLSVIPVFTSTEGEMLVGDQARYLLPGKQLAKDIPRAKSRTSGGVVAASYSSENASESDQIFSDETVSQLRMKTTTIKVPRSVQQRLRLKGKAVSPRLNSQADTKRIDQNPTAGFVSQQNATPRPETSPKKMWGPIQLASANEALDSSSAEMESIAAKGSTVQPSVDSERGQRRAQTWQSARQAFAREPIRLGREGSLFDR